MPVEGDVESGGESGEEEEYGGFAAGPDYDFFEGIMVAGVHGGEVRIVSGVHGI